MREAKKRRKGVDLTTFSTKVEELVSLYHGMTAANRKKAAVILSSAWKDMSTIASQTNSTADQSTTVSASSAWKDMSTIASDTNRTADQATTVSASVLSSGSPQPHKRGRIKKNACNTTNQNSSEGDGEFTSLLQDMLETIVAKEDGLDDVQQGRTRNLRQRRSRTKSVTPRTGSRPKACVREGETTVYALNDNGASVESVEDVSKTGIEHSAMNEKSPVGKTGPVFVPSFKEAQVCRRSSPPELEDRMSVPVHQNEPVAPSVASTPRRTKGKVTRSVGFEESNIDMVLEIVEDSTPGEALGETAGVYGNQGHMVLGNGAIDASYDNGDCDDLLDLELDIYNEANEDTEIDEETLQNDKSVAEPVPKLKTKIHNVVHKCQECGEMFTHGRPFKRHLLGHADSHYPLCCRRCKMEFEAFIVFKYHKCQPPSRELSCNQCQTKCLNDKRLQRHMRLNHSRGGSEPRYFCKYCNKAFSRKRSMFKHYKVHAGGKFVCLRCGEFIEEKGAYYEHVTKHDRDVDFMCEKCGLDFSKMQLYRKHMKTHERFECPGCNMTFSTRKAQFRHNRLVHAAQFGDLSKRYRCDVCPKSFTCPGMLEVHKRVHTGERPLECDLCKVYFRTPKALRKHKMTNTHLLKAGEMARERNHLCALCGQSYFRKYALQRHMKTHCDDKPFNCPHCEYKCKESTNLKRHIMRHLSERNFICEMCGASFHTKKTLETHVIYKHSSNRDYKCAECTMTFKTPNALRRHMTSHSDKRPHTCWCGSGFNRMYNLRRHMKTVHGTDDELPRVRKVRVLEEDMRDVYAPLTIPVVTSAGEMPLFSAHDGIPPMVSMPRPLMQPLKHDYISSVCSQGILHNQNPSLFTLTPPSLSLPDLKSVHLPHDMNYAIMSQTQLSEDEKVAHVTSHLLSELRESVKQAEMTVMAPVHSPASTPVSSVKDDQQAQMSTLASVGMETVLQDIVHRPTINTYDSHLYLSQPTSAPVERKPFIHNMPPNYIHDFTNLNTATLYGGQFYSDPQRQRIMQMSDGLSSHEQLHSVANGTPVDLDKYHQDGTHE